MYIQNEGAVDGVNYILDELLINWDKERYYASDDEYDKQVAAWLVDRLLLSKNIPFPTPPGIIDSEKPIFKHSMIGCWRSNSDI